METFSAISVIPREPFFLWAKSVSEGININPASFMEDPALWIIPQVKDFSSEKELQAFLSGLKLELFPKMLSSWEPDPSAWPQFAITAEAFDQWFELKIHRNARFALDLFDEGTVSQVLEGLDGEAVDDLEDDAGAEAHYEALIEIIEDQINANDPPEVKKTFKRLVADGVDAEEAKGVIGNAFLSETHETKEGDLEYDREAYLKKLELLP